MARVRVYEENYEILRKYKSKLQHAFLNHRSQKWCLYIWSQFIKERDGHQCVNCDQHVELQAHHIIRKVICPNGIFDLGNGITLCKNCHRKIHETFNARPRADERLNERGGDDPDYFGYLYGLIADDAKARGIPEDEFYHISDNLFEFTVAYQGYEMILRKKEQLNISRIRLIHELWRNAPMNWYRALGDRTLLTLIASE